MKSIEINKIKNSEVIHLYVQAVTKAKKEGFNSIIAYWATRGLYLWIKRFNSNYAPHIVRPISFKEEVDDAGLTFAIISW